MKTYIIVAVVFLLSNGTSYYYGSQKPAEVKIVERVVIKRDVETRIVEVVKPDGSKEIVTVIVDKSKESSSKKNITKVTQQKDWLVGAYYNVSQPTYALSLNRRILGPLFIGVHADLNNNYYIGLSYEF